MADKKTVDATETARLYSSGLTSTEVGRLLGTSHNVIIRTLREAGIFIRPRHWSGGVIVSGGYAYVKRLDHPRANSRGYVMRAILVWEEANGRQFPEGMFPHHDNEIMTDDNPDNIKPMTRPEHARLHMKRRHERDRQSRQGNTLKNNVEHKKPGNENGVGC